MRDDKSYISENHLTTGLASLSRFYLDNNQSWLSIFSPIWSPPPLVMICKTSRKEEIEIIDTDVVVITTWVANLFCFVSATPYGNLEDLYNPEYEDYDQHNEVSGAELSAPRFVSSQLDLVVNEGETIRLPCIVTR